MKRKIPVKTKIEAVNDYLTSGLSLKAVCVKYGVSHESVRKWASASKKQISDKFKVSQKRAKLAACKRNLGFFNQQKRWTSLEDESLVEAVVSGMTVGETSGLLGRTPSSIYTRKHKLFSEGMVKERFTIPEGIKRSRKQKEVPLETPDVAEVVEKIEVIDSVNTSKIKEVPEISMEEISNISIERIAEIVSKFGVSMCISVSGDHTTVQISQK